MPKVNNQKRPALCVSEEHCENDSTCCSQCNDDNPSDVVRVALRDVSLISFHQISDRGCREQFSRNIQSDTLWNGSLPIGDGMGNSLATSNQISCEMITYQAMQLCDIVCGHHECESAV